MAELLSSRVVIIEQPPRVRAIQGVATAVAGAVGVAERGPIGVPVLVTSIEEYQRTFGGFTTQSDLALAALGFFQNGGSQLHVVRTVHYTNPAEPATASATRATAALASAPAPAPAEVVGAAAPFTLTAGAQLIVSEGASSPVTITFSAGNVDDLAAVTLQEVRELVEAAVPGIDVDQGPGGALRLRTVAVGATAQLQVRSGTASAFGLGTTVHNGSAGVAATVLRLGAESLGSWGNRLRVEVRAGGTADTFELAVSDAGIPRERFPNLSMNPSSAGYVERTINDPQRGSRFLRITEPPSGGAAVPAPQTVALAGGGDGLSGLADSDFTGSEAGRTGLHALNTVQDLSLLIVPGKATATIHTAMLQYCELVRGGLVFAILDSPANHSAAQIVSYLSSAGLKGLSEFGALYWPRIRVPNPDTSVFGSVTDVPAPPSGVVAGVYARTDGAKPGGVYEAPAGVENGRMFGVLGLETDEANDEKKRDLVYPHRINPLRTESGAPRYIDGSRTLKGDSNFPSIPERRGVSFIERSLRSGLESARHRNNDERLRAEVRNTITAFLTTQMNLGAFASRDPKTAFYIDVKDDVQARFRGELPVEVGLATNKPAEWIVIYITADTRALEAAIAPS